MPRDLHCLAGLPDCGWRKWIWLRGWLQYLEDCALDLLSEIMRQALNIGLIELGNGIVMEDGVTGWGMPSSANFIEVCRCIGWQEIYRRIVVDPRNECCLTCPEICFAQQDLLIAVDGSGSGCEDGFDMLKNYTLDLLSEYHASGNGHWPQ